MISIAFASYILLALVVHLTLKQASYNNGSVKPSSKSRLPANQFPAAGLAVDFCQQYYPLDARHGREIASKKDCRYQRCGLYYLYRTIQIMEKLNR
uniref:hypothetical protein n=1 Tax=Enterobacter cloacae TaxID=550 RepID=UPI0015EEA1F0|nr:hypothetical protein [Enterobacter cloacae]